MQNGKCIILSAPSGAGKTTLVQYLLEQELGLSFSISACTREKRANEIHGIDYYFYTTAEFKKLISENAFIEWEEVYEDHFYGTLFSEIQKIWDQGRHVIFDVDVIGGLNLKKYFGDRALSIFVMPPDIETLEKRLRSRDSETEEKLQKRIEKAESELSKAGLFDRIIVNDNLKDALEEVVGLVKDFLAK